MDYSYSNEMLKQLSEIFKGQREEIEEAISEILRTLKEDKIIHTFGSGHSHMVGLELFIRAGGLGNVNAMLDQDVLTSNGALRSSKLEKLEGLADIIWDEYNIEKDDIIIIISNSGRNALPIEMALRAKKEGVKVIAITSLKQTKEFESRHSSGKKLYEIADIVLDNKVISGDGILEVEGTRVGAMSSINGMFIINTIVTEVMVRAEMEGIKLPIYKSQNIDSFAENDELYKKYRGRVKLI
ncbi:MAG: sugar isomerase domain-containing protein [Sebaldella sp.]|nr:sugar isomerase domain-containing protein [Sebaldella sp.]